MVKNGHALLDQGTLKSAVSQEWVDELSWFFTCWYNSRKLKNYVNNYWVGVVKNGRGLSGYGTLKSSVSQWMDDLSWFFAYWQWCNSYWLDHESYLLSLTFDCWRVHYYCTCLNLKLYITVMTSFYYFIRDWWKTKASFQNM